LAGSRATGSTSWRQIVGAAAGFRDFSSQVVVLILKRCGFKRWLWNG